MQERRKAPRISVERSVTVHISDHPPLILKMIDISSDGMGFLCPIAPEINPELELLFNLPSMYVTRDFRFTAKVMHLYEVIARPDTPPEYRYVVGVKFTNIQKSEFELFEELLQKLSIYQDC